MQLVLVLLPLLSAVVAHGAVYHVNPSATNASDSNAGTGDAPWLTIERAGAAPELKPGDTVLIHSGLYREHVQIKVSGERDRPITFAAAPGARVVIKGSELVRGGWSKVSDDPERKEPYPNAFTDVWKVRLGDEFFSDPRFEGCYRDKSRRWVSQVFVSDRPLQRIGPDPIYRNDEYLKLAIVGRDLSDICQDAFYFDAVDQMLYVKMSGDPAWFAIEVGVRGYTLTAERVHDVVLRGFEFRHNRQPGGQWSMVSIGECERVVVDECRVLQSDFCGLGMGGCHSCVVRGCDLSHNGNTGLGMGECEDCVIEECTVMFNNYRQFHPGWHAGGMKCIPRNRRCTVRNCEAAYNINSDGIWFDADNADIRIVGNVSHHNDGCGIFFEINREGGLIADNLVYANRGRGIYISGSQKTWIVHNTLAANVSGVVCMPRGDDWPLDGVRVLNNLFLGNTLATESHARGADLTLFMGCADDTELKRTVTGNHSDCNVFSDSVAVPMMRHSWNPDNTLAAWRKHFGEDLHSTVMSLPCELKGVGFELPQTDGLGIATNLPRECGWVAPVPGRVGALRTRWP